MRNRLISLLLFVASASPCMGDVLLWLVDTTATVDGGSIFQYISAIPEDDYNWNAARVRVSGGSLSSPQYLPIYGEDEFGNTELLDGDMGMSFGESGGFWGCGVPVGNQSPILNGLLGEYLFAVELGRGHWDETTDFVSWTTLAQSADIRGEDLAGYIYPQYDLNPPTNGIWIPTEFYTVPEPSTMLLILLGVSVVLLRRKHCQ